MTVSGQLNQDFTTSVGTTTDGVTKVVVYSNVAFPSPTTNGAQQITFEVVGVDFDNNEMASAKIVTKLINTDGVVSLVGTPIHTVPISTGSSPGLTTASVTFEVSGQNVVVEAIGVSGKTIKWSCNRYPELSVLDNWTAVSAPEDGYVPVWRSARSRIEFEGSIPVTANLVGVAGGDLSGNFPNPTVAKINAASVPTIGAVGNALQVTGASSLGYSAINLAGGANHVTGILPAANTTTLAGNVTGSIAGNTVAKINGASVPASGALTTGNILQVSGVNSLTYGPLNLSNSNAVTGILPSTNISLTLNRQVFTSGGTWTCPAGVTIITLEGWGGGGGGSGGAAANGGGGGGGSMVSIGSITVVPTTIYTVTIGAGGPGGAASATSTPISGTDGYDTTFGTLYVAKGASGGKSTNGGYTVKDSTFTVTQQVAGPGCGGQSATPLSYPGGAQSIGYSFIGGTAGIRFIVNAAYGYGGGGGGQGPGGSGGNGGNGNTAVNGNASIGVAAAANSGGGGGGAGGVGNGSGTRAAGGTGGSGKLIVTWLA